MKEKKVARILPLSMKMVGEKLGQIHCHSMGLPHGCEDYESEFSDYVFNFNHEGYELSMTPSGQIGRNPATPKVQENYFNLASGVFGADGFISNLSVDSDTKEKYRRLLRGNIIALVHFIMEARYGATIKRKGERNSDFEFSKDSTTNSQEEVLYNQYARLYFTMKLVRAIEPLITKYDDGYADYFEKVFGQDWKNTKNGGVDLLRKKESREAYAKAVYDELGKKTIAMAQNPIVKKQDSHTFKKGEDFIYCLEESLYFDKRKIDKMMKELDTVEITPNESYVTARNITKDQIEKANMKIPAVCGSRVGNNGKIETFLISGEGQILKALDKGLPVIDFIILDPAQTLACMMINSKTRNKYEAMKKNLQRYSTKFNI